MKFVRQKDRSASYTGPNGAECWYPPHYVEEGLVEFWLTTFEHGIEPEVLEAEDGAFFDPGGMVMVGEPRIEVVANGQKLGCYLRSAESLLPLIRRPGRWREGVDGPAHHFIRGAYKHTVLTPATAIAGAILIEEEWRVRADECDELWAKRNQALADLNVVDRRGERNPRYPSQPFNPKEK